MTLKVVAPLVITKREDGTDVYLYNGAVLPDYVSKDEVKRLKDEKFVVQEGFTEPDAPKAAEPEPSKQTGHEDDPAKQAQSSSRKSN